VALLGALMLVKLLMLGGDKSCAMVLGRAFGDLAGRAWVLCAPFLGALGAFFAGSNTVSNLTFGGIQLSIAKTLGLDVTLIVALQSVGGAMGHMVCLHNIVTVAAILGIPTSKEGEMLRKTFLPMGSTAHSRGAGLALSALGVFKAERLRFAPFPAFRKSPEQPRQRLSNFNDERSAALVTPL
jgi:L-lactate permease